MIPLVLGCNGARPPSCPAPRHSQRGRSPCGRSRWPVGPGLRTTGRHGYLRQILAALPAGSWTTFGDLATVVGVRASVVGAYMSNRASLENAHRVLTSEGIASESSRDVLEQEGVSFT